MPAHLASMSEARETGMKPVVDDDDWIGTPPEGHYSRDRAKPEFWRAQWQARAAGAGLLIAILVLVVVLVAR
jgi:hypothetical protein